MTAVLWVLNALRKLPREVWLFALAVLAAWSMSRAILSYGAAKYALGKRDAAQGVVFDSVMLSRAAERVAKQIAHTDTVWLQAKASAKKATAAVAALSPDVAALPPVDTLVQAVTALVAHVDSTDHAITAERAAWTERAKVDSAAIYALRILGTARGDTIATLRKRPRWRTVVVGTLTGAATGAAAVILRR